jgi:hypothetical protein
MPARRIQCPATPGPGRPGTEEEILRRTLPATALAVLLVGCSASAAQTPVPVLATAAIESQPAAAAGWLAWSESPRTRPTQVSVYARATGQPRLRLNAPGTIAFTTGGAIDGTNVVYSERLDLDQPGDLRFFDLGTGARTDPPAGVNTARAHEWGGARSGDWLLFERETIATSTERIILFNLRTGQAKQLDVTSGRAYAQTGGMRGNYATWIRCSRQTRCTTYVHDIAAGTTVAVPNPSKRAQYAASVTATGVVYFAESRDINCGANVALWRYPVGGTRTKLLSIARGRDVSEMSALRNPDGSTSLFFDRYVCRTGAADILRLEVAP